MGRPAINKRLADRTPGLEHLIRSLRVADKYQWVHLGHTSVPFPDLPSK